MSEPASSTRRLLAPLMVPLAVTLLLQVIATASTLAVPLLTPTMPGATTTGIGWYLTVEYLGAMVGAVASGPLLNRLGPARSLQAALLLQIVGVALALTGQEHWRLLGGLICGMGYGPITPSSSQILAQVTPPHHTGLVFSLKQSGVPLGGFLGGLMLVPIASSIGWQWAIFAMLGTSVAGMLLALLLHGQNATNTTRPQPSKAPWYESLLAILRNPALRGAATLSLGFSVVQLSLSGYLVLYLHEEIGLSLVQAGMIFGAAQLGGVFGRLGWGRLADLTGSVRAVLIALGLLMGSGSLLIGWAGPDWPLPILLAIAVLFGCTAIGWNGVFLAEIARLSPPGAVAATTGGVLFFTYIGVVVGPTIFAQVSRLLGGLGAGFIVLTLVPLLALLTLRHRSPRT